MARAALEPRAIVIKSACMRKLASQLRSFTEIWLKERADTRRAR